MAEWIVSKFPQDYQKMDYLEPFLGDGSVMLSKERSAEEVGADSDAGLVSVWRAIRDEHSAFSSRIKKTCHSKSTFERFLKSSGGDYMDEAIREFVLRQMTKSGEKKSYIPKGEGARCGDCWCGLFDRMPEVHGRLEGVFLVAMDAVAAIKAFSHDKCLVFCDPPDLSADNSKFHSELGDALCDFRGLAVVCARNSAMYRRVFSEWNRKGLPGSKNESLWTNF